MYYSKFGQPCCTGYVNTLGTWYSEYCISGNSSCELSCFDPGKLDSLTTSKVAWWDETHENSTIGGLGHNSAKMHYAIFPRDKNGKLNLENGEYGKMKYKLFRLSTKKRPGCA
jgi:hypothetical protein